MKERRNFSDTINTADRLIEGYAVVFNSESQDLGGFNEVIDSTALDGVIERSDVMALLDHNQARGILARSRQGKGSLILEIDERGLKYTFEAPNTALGDELLEGLRRGDICASSFAFTVENDKWTKRSDGTYLRTINKIKQLFDVSPVYTPAYEATDVSIAKRSLDDLKEQEKEKELEELRNYYKQLREEIK